MFDLDQAVAAWRRTMREANFRNPAVLDELESHLRDEIDALSQSGHDRRQAFETALQRIGSVETLTREFTSEQRFKDAILVGVMALYALVGGVPVLFRLGSFWNLSAAQQRSALAAIAVTVIPMCAGRFFGRVLPAVSRPRLIAIACVSVTTVFVWLALFYQHVMTRAEWDMSQLVVAILWAFTPMTFLGGIFLGLEQAAAERTPKSHV